MKFIRDEALIGQYLKQFSLDPNLDHSQNENIHLIELQPGELISQQDEEAKYFYLLCKGRVKIFATSEAGKRIIVAFNEAPELFGDIEYVQHVPYMNTIETLTPSHIMKLPFSLMTNIEKAQPHILRVLLESITRKFYTKSKTLSFHLLNEVDIRFASYLLSITTSENSAARDQISKYELREIAEFIGTSSRHLNRIIKTFTDEQVVQRHHGSLLILNRQALIERACGNVYEIQ